LDKVGLTWNLDARRGRSLGLGGLQDLFGVCMEYRMRDADPE